MGEEVERKPAAGAQGTDLEPINQERRLICDRCGFEMYELNCKILCPNCGNRFDCSDLNIYFD